MTVAEITKKKIKLQGDIMLLLSNFGIETGLSTSLSIKEEEDEKKVTVDIKIEL